MGARPGNRMSIKRIADPAATVGRGEGGDVFETVWRKGLPTPIFPTAIQSQPSAPMAKEVGIAERFGLLNDPVPEAGLADLIAFQMEQGNRKRLAENRFVARDGVSDGK